MIQISELKFVDEIRNGQLIDIDSQKRLVKHLRNWFENFEIEVKIKVVEE